MGAREDDLLKRQIESWGGKTDRSGIVYAPGYQYFLAYWVDDSGVVSGIGMGSTAEKASELLAIQVIFVNEDGKIPWRVVYERFYEAKRAMMKATF